MISGLRTPLLDVFRRGEVARDVRLLAAAGGVAPRALEQLALLGHLASDPDAEVRATAEATLAALPAARVAGLLARADAPEELRAFFAKRGLAPAAAAQAGDAPLVDTDGGDYGPEDTPEPERASLVARVAGMTVPEKVRAAMKGPREMRALLIRDPNKLVALTVLSSPKVTETEVETFARMTGVAEDVLRAIAHSRAWTRHYPVVAALVRNPKTPVALSLNLLARLHERDVRAVSIDRNVPEPLRIAARKRVVLDGGRK